VKTVPQAAFLKTELRKMSSVF